MKVRLIRTAFISVICIVLCLGFGLPALAYAADYEFSSGADTRETFGKPTGYDEPVHGDPLAVNQRRNKDAAFLPPSYGFFSGDFPTGPSSLYHDNSVSGGYTQIRGMEPDGAYNLASADTAYAGAYASGSSSVEISYSDAPGVPPASTSVSAGQKTAPKYYEDGSMGTLHIQRLDKTLKVYEGETLENMKRGIGHFESTSAWDGNVGFAGHNRGAAGYFGFVKNLNTGDKITYTTPYGSRVYEVSRKEKINEYDYTGLGWSADNTLTLITCVENQSELRWLVQAVEIR